MRWCGRCWARREIGVFNELDARRKAQSNVDVGGRSRPLVEHLTLHVRRKSQSLGPAVELVAIMLAPHRRAAFAASCLSGTLPRADPAVPIGHRWVRYATLRTAPRMEE